MKIQFLDIPFKSFGIDSRDPKEVFFALKGKKVDGHDFIEDAIQNGAKACVVENSLKTESIKKKFPNIYFYEVPDPFETLREWAVIKRNLFHGKVIAVGGSSGKTSTKTLLLHLLPKSQGTKGSQNGEIGVPLTLLNLSLEADFWVIEIGIDAVGFMENLAEIAKPNISVITKLGIEHLQGFGSLEIAQNEEWKLMEYTIKTGGIAIRHPSDPEQKNRPCTHFEIDNFKEKKWFEEPFMQDNARLVQFLLKNLNLWPFVENFDPKSFQNENFRSTWIRFATGLEVFRDEYNANPDSMWAAIEYFLSKTNQKKRILILGEMRELGSNSKNFHREIESKVLKKIKISDQVFFIGTEWTNPNFKTPEEFKIQIHGNESIFIKGSRGLRLERITDHILKKFRNKTTKNILFAKSQLLKGNLVAIPTETVYGLAAHADQKKAISKIFELKNRPKNNPLILHFSMKLSLLDLIEKGWIAPSEEEKEDLEVLFKHFIPGPLTVVTSKGPRANQLITSGQNTIAIRSPDSIFSQAILSDFEVVAPSANRSNHLSPTKAKHVIDDFFPNCPIVFEGGNCLKGIESTIIHWIKPKTFEILRYGSFDCDELAIKGFKIVEKKTDTFAPGRFKKHYSPKIPLFLKKIEEFESTLKVLDKRVAFVTIKKSKFDFYLSKNGSPVHSAKRLFWLLRQIEKKEFDEIWVENFSPRSKIESALYDRLFRASVKE